MVVLEREALERLPDLGSLCFRFVSVFSWKKCERSDGEEWEKEECYEVRNYGACGWVYIEF